MPLTIIATVTTSEVKPGPLADSTLYHVTLASDDPDHGIQTVEQVAFNGAYPTDFSLGQRLDRTIRNRWNVRGYAHGWNKVYTSPNEKVQVFEIDYDGWKS